MNQSFFCRFSKGTSSHCSSSDEGSDNCSATVRDTDFYVTVLAYSRLSNAKLEITGGNIASVEEVDADDQTTISPTTISPTTLTSVSKFSILILVQYVYKFSDLVPFLDQIYQLFNKVLCRKDCQVFNVKSHYSSAE